MPQLVSMTPAKPTTKRSITHTFVFVLGAACFATGTARAQAHMDRVAEMQTIAAALGVHCQFCHSAPKGSGQVEPKKDIARAMMAMTSDLNAKVEAATGKAATDAARVTCITCHRGVSIPKQLNEIIARSERENGPGVAAEQFRDLRNRYFGHQAYDFGEDTLLTVAEQISQSKPDDAIALLRLNLEYYPRSSRSYAAISFAYTRKLDDLSAIENLEKAVEIEPENGLFLGRLEQLKRFQGRR